MQGGRLRWVIFLSSVSIFWPDSRLQPGTYDTLSHLLFEPLPTAGSSGGPIIDEETGAVVGVMVGTRMDSQVEGVRGWGVPSEAIFNVSHSSMKFVQP